jgi:hypothetical protein
MTTQIEPDARAARFSRLFSYHDDPKTLQELERAAAAEGASAASVVRSAVRHWLAEHDAPEPRVG